MVADTGGSPTPGTLIEIAAGLALPGVAMTFAANEGIFTEGRPADFVYRVASGAVRTTRLLSDGSRQIGAFYFAGDVFGMQCGARHRFSAEAITLSEIAFVRRSALEDAAERDSAAARRLWTLTSHELEDLQDHMVLLGRKEAAARVGCFLLKLAARASSPVVELPMSRGDIADHLGLTLETVSRTMTQLARAHAIALPSARCVILCDAAALRMA
ncbi:MAG TPA: helix-turn-helix domain-containing protein [Caulobacteraceae bacterium]|jgi:CRP/FNR family nitrogen fixation transcriptional regulator